MKKRTKVTLFNHQTAALRISGFSDPVFESFFDSSIYLGNIYRRIMPPSLPRVASIMEKELPVDVEILDLRIAEPDLEETYNIIDWEGYQIEAIRVGAPFGYADQAICESDWIGLSSHFTYESGIIRDLIAHAKRVNPHIKIMIGGADVKARPAYYKSIGADLIFVGDFNPLAFAQNDQYPEVVGPYLHPLEEFTTPSFDKLSHLARYTDSHDGPVPPGVSSPIAFLYFTRGCPRECDFCESRKTGFEVIDLNAAFLMLESYRNAGIRTINFADDNLLLLAAKKSGRDQLLEMMKVMREMGFAWEFPNGLEMGRLITHGKLDEELMEQLFYHGTDLESGRTVGAYRLYVPIETFDKRERYRKLKPMHEQNTILEWLASSGLSEIDFGVVLPPDAEENTFTSIKEGYLDIKKIISDRGRMMARYSVFHLIPIALYRSMATKYSVESFPEGWNFYFPVYDGVNFSARELFERRLRLIQEIDPANYESMKTGKYAYA